MRTKTSKPPGLASQGGSELHCFGADAVRIDTATLANFQVETDARRAVAEMAANGAVFHVYRRENGNFDFTFELPAGGNLSRCRRIVTEMKAAPLGVWNAFVKEIVDHVGGA